MEGETEELGIVQQYRQPREAVKSPSLEIFKIRLDKDLNNLRSSE